MVSSVDCVSVLLSSWQIPFSHSTISLFRCRAYNYCFADPESTVLLCPYGAGVNYLNHPSDKRRVNVRIRWAQQQHFVGEEENNNNNNKNLYHNHTLVTHGSLDDLIATQHKSHLAWEYVTTQDVQPDEELFLDYGPEWHAAWIQHQTQQRDPNDNYISARQYNRLFHDLPLRTMEQVKYDPYPDNLHLRCHTHLQWEPADRQAEYVWAEKDRGLACRVLHRFVEHNNNNQEVLLYTVQLELHLPSDAARRRRLPPIVDPHAAAHTNFVWVTRTDVPHSALRFFDRPYTTPWSRSSTAFRHPIGMPPGLFPEQWKNKKLEERRQ